MKKTLYLIFIFLKIAYSQNNISPDTLYLNIDENNIENFEDVYIENFSFKAPTFNPELGNDKFLNSSSNIHFKRDDLSGLIKKVSKFVKYPSNDEKHLQSFTIYNKRGLKSQLNEKGYIKTYFYYDSKDRLSKNLE